jgi:hypothetical protein
MDFGRSDFHHPLPRHTVAAENPPPFFRSCAHNNLTWNNPLNPELWLYNGSLP